MRKKFIKTFIGSDEFINGWNRYCLWLVDINPAELKSMPLIMERIKKVKELRLNSTRAATNKLAATPHLFGEIRYSNSDFLIVPRVSSERRIYIPIGFMPSDIIVNDRCAFVPNATLYEFRLITSIMHMTWVRYTCGRLKSDYNYSNQIVYNNYPFPKDVSEKKKEAVELAAQAVLDIRKTYTEKGNTLADLYDPNTMPPDLLRAHQTLDKAVGKCYRDAAFTTEPKRIEYLFELYEKYTADLFTPEKKKRGKK